MRISITFLTICILSSSCEIENKKSDIQKISIEEKELEEAKWFFYCYSSKEVAYFNLNESVSPLLCDIKLKTIEQRGQDTVDYYFNFFYKDSSMRCTIKPSGLIGVSCFYKKMYIPIYTHATLVYQSDSIYFRIMSNAEKTLKEEVKKGKLSIKPWLKEKLKFK